MKKLTNQQYIEKCILKHGNKYDYSLVNYTKDKCIVTIICPYHGQFNQRSDHHISTHGCQACGYQSGANKNSSNAEEFINRSNKIHNNKYDYSLVNYKNAKTKVTIICPIHGEFKVSPDAHLKTNCIKCTTRTNAEKQRADINIILSKCVEIHNNKYDYSNIGYYTNTKAKLEIICPIHGTFLQNINNHLYCAKGCPACNTYSKSELYITKLLKHNNIKFISQHKFHDCINKKTNRKYRFDFYIPHINTILEYDGQQHFKDVSIWRHSYLLTQAADTIKNNYCINNNITLIRIPYWENITDKLLACGIIDQQIPNHIKF